MARKNKDEASNLEPTDEGEGTGQDTVIHFGSVAVSISPTYEEGHTCSAIEAAVLNQVRVENIRNNLRTRFRTAEEKNETPPTAEEAQEYANEYSFASKSPRGVAVDPVDAEERRLCTLLVRAKMDQQGIKKASVDKETFNAWVDRAIATGRMRQRAESIVASRKAAREADLDIDLAA